MRNNQKKVGSSIRPIETIALTAEKFGLNINNRFQRDDATAVAQDILGTGSYDGKTILISWEHDAILRLVTAFGFQQPPALQNWPGDIFDQAWILSFDSSGTLSLEIVAEHILPTDIDETESGIANWGPEKTVLNNGIIVPRSIVASCAAGNRVLDGVARNHVLVPGPGL